MFRSLHLLLEEPVKSLLLRPCMLMVLGWLYSGSSVIRTPVI
jgi:hypothetical protein